MFKQTNKRTAIMKKLFSQVYQEQIDTATVGTSDEGFDVEIKHKEGRRMFNFGWKNGHTLEECLAKWKKQVDLQVESCKIVESFTGLSIEEVMAHPKYSHSRYRRYGSVETVSFYCRVPDSPSGVMGCGGCSAEELHRVKTCLSPTEGL